MSTANFGTPRYDLPLIVSDDDEYKYENAQWLIERINGKLSHFDIVIEGGYYEGFMFNVEQRDGYIDYEDIPTLTDEDAKYFYGDSAKNIKNEFKKDMQAIKKFLKDLKDEGYLELIKVAQFSNGEAIYKEV